MMAAYIEERTLDLTKEPGRTGQVRAITLRRGENAATEIRATLTENGKPFNVSGYDVKLKAILADENFTQISGSTVNATGGIVSVTVDSTLTSVSGVAMVAYIELKKNNIVATTDTIPIIVLGDMDLTQGEQARYQNEIDRLIALLDEAITDAKQAAKEAYQAGEEADAATARANMATAAANAATAAANTANANATAAAANANQAATSANTAATKADTAANGANAAAADANTATAAANTANANATAAAANANQAAADAIATANEGADAARKAGEDAVAIAKAAGDEAREIAASAGNELKARADAGEFDGATFIPDVDAECNVRWSNDKGLPNPLPRNIRGPQGTGLNPPKGAFDTYEELQESQPTGEPGDSWLVGGDLYVWTDEGAWINAGPLGYTAGEMTEADIDRAFEQALNL